jgi:DNA-binding MarR family transcriptional regulator
MSLQTRGVIPAEGPLLKRTKPGDALFLLLRAYRVAADGVDERFRELDGLSLSLWEVLVILSMAPNMRLRMADITLRMLVSKSNVTKLVDKLERAGLVRREASPTDRRVVFASLTPRGVEAVKRGGDIFNAAAREYLGRHLTATEMRSLGSGLSRTIAAGVAALKERQKRGETVKS